MKWEYFSMILGTADGSLDINKLIDSLNGQGKKGWELVSLFPLSVCMGTTSYVVAVFKKPCK